jgi:replicative DNA helicase
MAKETITNRTQEQKKIYNTYESTMGVVGKLTPQALDFEEAVLGALLIDDKAVSAVIDFIQPEMFYKESHQMIYKAIRDLFSELQPVDLLTVTNQLRKLGRLDIVGGAVYLASLTHRIASAANIEYHARIVMEKYVLRELITRCNGIIKDAYDETTDVLTLLDKAESELFKIVENNFKRDSKELGTVVKKTLDELNEIRNAGGVFNGTPSGIRALDEKTGGWQKSDLVIIAARPGMGKTSLVLTIARNAAIDYERPVVIFSLEMSANQLVHRLFSMESGIASDKISKGQLNEAEWVTLAEKISKLLSNKLIIDDTPALNIFDLRAKCRRLKQSHDIQLVIVDYLQLMQGDPSDGKGKGNREQEISYISRSLKSLAKDLDVPVIALSQLNRSVETRGGSKRPQLSDLRESGSIEQDADMVMFIYRPEYYKLESFEDNTPSQGMAELMIQKNRHGSSAEIRVRFQAKYTRFSDVDEGFRVSSPLEGIYDNDSYATFDSSVNNDLPSSSNIDTAFPNDDFVF